MKRYIKLLRLIGALLLILSISYVNAEQEEDVEAETCSLDPSNAGDCATTDESATSSPYADALSFKNLEDLTRQVISLNDETFDALTWTSQPSTWLIMFKTDACGLCRKTKPVLESLAVDDDIINHNDEQMKETGNINNIVVEETENYEEQSPKGMIYIATIDAGSWAGRDITKRFEVDGTPHIILIRNEGYGEVKEESRSYCVYRGQRALYPLRRFVLGEFVSRKQLEMPPPLSDEEKKKSGFFGRLYDYLLLPGFKWAANIVGKIFIAWFVFIGLLGLFMRVHNYAWGDNADDLNNEDEIEKEKAKGRAEYEEDKDEKAKRRQRIMWERKKANHEKRMQKNKETSASATAAAASGSDGDGGDGDEFQGVGKSVKRSDAMKTKAAAKQNKK